jgi:transketolase
MTDLQYKATRDGFGQGLVQAADRNDQVVGLCADLTGSMRMRKFVKKFPNRFVQVGVAEQNLVATAAGLALGGKIPFAASFAAFSPSRSYDQIRTTVAYSDLNVTIVGGHGGLATGEDGATHQMLEDIAMMTALPEMVVVQPCDAEQARQATLALAEHTGPAYLRLSRPKVKTVSQDVSFELGQSQILKKGTDITIFSTGIVTQQALTAAHKVESEGISVQLINIHTLKPIDEQAILKAARETQAIITVEDHQINGGLGSTVCQVLAQNYTRNLEKPVPVKLIGVEDRFGESGHWKKLYQKYGLSSAQIVDQIKQILS